MVFQNTTKAQQSWKRFFHDTTYGSYSYDVIESYDGGYILGGVLKSPDGRWPGWLVKTDINGNVIWNRIIGDSLQSPFAALGKTNDNGFILGGRYNSFDNHIDAYVMKFNSCGDQEWCSFFPDANGDDSEISSGIYQLPDGSYICERYKPIWQNHYRWSLIKIRPNGTMEWMNYYDLNTSWTSQIDLKLIFTSDTCFIVNGFVSDTLSNGTGYASHPFWYKVDNDGNLLWEQKWEINQSQSLGDARKTVEDKYGNYYGGGSLYRPVGFSHLFKLNHNGDTISSYNINEYPMILGSRVETLNYLNDSLLIGTGFGIDYQTWWWSLNITDTLGNIRKGISEEEQISFVNSIVTHDNKFLILGITSAEYPGHPDMAALYKFNTNLEYDSIYTMPRTYDSLCPHPIVSDTIPMPGNCITVGLPEAPKAGQNLQLKIYPNPAREYVTIEVPEYSVTVTTTSFGTQQQFRPLTGEVQLSFMALSGQIVLSQTFDASLRNQVVSLKGLAPGMYMIHLSQKGKVVADGKVMVVR